MSKCPRIKNSIMFKSYVARDNSLMEKCFSKNSVFVEEITSHWLYRTCCITLIGKMMSYSQLNIQKE